MNNDTKSELSSHEGTRGQFNGRKEAIKLGIDLASPIADKSAATPAYVSASTVVARPGDKAAWALVEAAWRLVRFQPDYRAVAKWRHLLAKGALATGAARKKAIVAVARQLAVDLWRARHSGGLRIKTLKRKGSRGNRKKGTNQPNE